MGVVMNFVLVLRTTVSITKTCYRVVRYQPSVLFVILFFYLLYRFVPSVFNLLLSSFPLLTCTVALIASLVALGHGSDTHQTSQAVDEQKHQSSPKSKHVKDEEPIIEKDKKTCEETTNDVKTLATDINEKPVGSIKLAGGLSRRQKSKKRVSFSPINFESLACNTTIANYKWKEIHEDGKLEIDKPILGEISDNQREAIDSSQDPSLKQNDGIAESLSSDSVSGPTSSQAESSSSDASVVDINPVTTDAPSQPVLLSIDEFDGAPEESDRSNEDGFELEAEKNGTKSVSTWTEDDEKNLMDLGESEIERNQRLESLMARRRARKKMLRMVAEKNLIDLDPNDPPIQIASLAVIKNNPFDNPTENEIPGLPPIPGSAPSVLIPRANPFDLPYDPQEERPNLTGDSFHAEFLNVIQKDIFCRHESFCYGSTSYSGGLKQDKSDNNIRSYSVNEDMGSLEQIPRCARSDSTSSLGTEIELRSLVPDEEDQMKPIEEQSAQECELMPPIDQSDNFIEGTIQSPEADVVEIHQEKRSEAYMKPDIVEEKYIGLSSSSSSEFSKNEVESQVMDLKRDDFKEGPSSAFNDSDFNSSMTVKEKDTSQTYETIYDSCPSAIEKRTIEGSLFCEDKGVVLTSVLSIASDMQVEVSEANSPSASSERNTAFTDEELLNYNENVRSCNSSVGEDLWAASPGLCTVDEIESKSNGVTEISDLDVINAGLFGACKYSNDASTRIPIEQKPVSDPVNSNPPPCPLETQSKMEGLMSQASSSSTEPEVDARVPQVDWKENVAPIASSSSARQLPHESLIVQQSRDGDHHNEVQEPPISSSKEHLLTDPLAVDFKTNLALLEEPSMQGSVNQSPSPNIVKEMHSQVYKLNLEETADTTASTSSLAHPSLENFTGRTSMDGNHLDEKQEVSFKPTEEYNTIKNVKDPQAIESYPTSSRICEPLNGNQNPLSSTEPEMHNHVEQLVLEDNVEPNPSSSSLSQVPSEEFVRQSPINNDRHEEAKEPSTKSMEEGDIIKDVNDSVSTDFKSTSSVDEPIKEGVMNENSSSAVEAEIMSNQVHLLKLEGNLDPEASISSVTQLPSEKSVVHPSMNDDHHEETKESPIISTEEGDIIKDVNDSVSTDSKSTSSVDEPIKEGVMNENSSSTVEPDIMSNQVHLLKLEGNVDREASSSSVAQLPSEKLVVHPSINNDHHKETKESSIISTEEENILKGYQHGMHPVTTDSHSTSSVMNEPIKEGLMNHNQSSSAEQEMHNQESKKITENAATQEQGIDANSNQESHETMESGAQRNQDFEVDQGKEKGSTGHLHNEQDVQLKPNTMRESGAVSSGYHSNEHKSYEMTESGTQSKQDFVTNHDLQKKTSEDIHDEQQAVYLIPETKLESSNINLDHGSSKLLEAIESDFNQNTESAHIENHQHLVKEITLEGLEKKVAIHQQQKPVSTILQSSSANIVDHQDTYGHENSNLEKSYTESGSVQKKLAFGGNLPLKNIIFKNLIEEEVWLTPKTTLEAITPRTPMTPKAAELEHHYHRNHSNDHGSSSNVPERTKKRTREETYEPSKPLQVTEVVILESVDHGSDNQDFDKKDTSKPQQNEQNCHGSDNQEVDEKYTSKPQQNEQVNHGGDNQDFGEKDTSKPQQNEQDIHSPQQVASDEMKLESGEHAVSSMMETEPAKEMRFEPNNLRNMIYNNLQQEEEIWLTPRTTADHYHNYQHDNESSNVQTSTSTPTIRKTERDSAATKKNLDLDEGNHHSQENETTDSKTLDYHENVVDESSNVQISTTTLTMRKTESDSAAAEKKVDFDEGNHHLQETETSDFKTLDYHENVVDESFNVQKSTSIPTMRKTESDSAAAEKTVDFDEGNHHPQENETTDSKTLDHHENVVDDKKANSTTSTVVKESIDE